MKNIEEKILMADEEIKKLQNKRKKIISQQKQEERKKRDRRLGLVYSVLTQKIGARLQTDKDLCYKAMHGLMVRVKELFAGYLLFQNKEMQQYAEDSFTQANGDFVEKKVRFGFHFANTTLLNQLLGQSFVVMIVAVAAYFVFVDHLTVGDLVAIAQLMTTMIAPLEELSEILNNRQASKNLWLRQKRYLTHLNKRDDLGRVKHDFKQAIVFDNVSYTLDDVSVLNAISLIVERGKKYAIVGDSGSGKSTVSRLLQKLGEPTSGECLIDGESYSVFSDRGLAPLFSYVAQEVFLFEGSIHDNICLFQAISEDTLTSIVKQTELDAVLARKEATLDTPIFENGLNLSGVERQRIALARALAQDAPILILDEATSALDKTSALSVMQAALQDPNRTVLSVTHHLSEEELCYYDALWVFHQGKITQQVDLHTHEKSTYPQLAG